MTTTNRSRSLWQSPGFTLLTVTTLVVAAFLVPIFAAVLIFPWWGPASPGEEATYNAVALGTTLLTLGVLGFGLKQAASRDTTSSVIVIGGLLFASLLAVANHGTL